VNLNSKAIIQESPYSSLVISRKGIERIDLLIMAIEILETNASGSMLSLSKELGLDSIFPNRVEFWKRRCYNPYRKTFRRGHLSNDEVEAFIILISKMADRLYPYIRQLLSSQESLILNNQRWKLFNDKMKELIKIRMNESKVHIANIIKSENSSLYFRQLLLSLSLSSGPGGLDRLRASVFDPTW